MPLEMQSQMDQRNHVSDGAQIPQRDGALLGECLAHCEAWDFGGLDKGWAVQNRVDRTSAQRGAFQGRDVADPT